MIYTQSLMKNDASTVKLEKVYFEKFYILLKFGIGTFLKFYFTGKGIKKVFGSRFSVGGPFAENFAVF